MNPTSVILSRSAFARRIVCSAACLASVAVSSAQVPTSGLVARYMLNANAVDDGPSGLNGTVHGTTLTTDHFGRPSSAYLFNGTSDYIQMPDNDVFSISTTGKYSISVWMRPDNLSFTTADGSGYLYYLSKLGSNQNEWAFRFYNLVNSANRPNRTSAYAFNLVGGQGQGAYVQETLTAGVWMHFVFTVDTTANLPGNPAGSGIVSIYKNGTLRNQQPLVGEYDVVPANGSAPVRFGTGNGTDGKYFQGSIGDACFYNRVLTTTEISDLYYDEAVAQPVITTPTSITTLTMSTTTPGASIRYTTNGTTPTETNGTLYSGPVTQNTDTTIKAIAYATGLVDSTVFTAAYATASVGGAWQTTAMTSQAGTFTVAFDSASAAATNDAVVGLSSGVQTAFANYSCLVRFNNAGYLDARNGAAYQADASVPYTANSIFHFRLVVNVSAQTYSIYVTPPGGSEVSLGSNYAFRASATSLDHWGVYVDSTDGTGNLTVANFVQQ